MSAGTEWIDLYHPEQQAWHRVPDNEAVVRYFRDLGWDTPEDSAARAEEEAGQLRGRDLDDALEAEGLSKSGTVKEKQARLAAKKAEATPTPEESAVPTENEGEQV
jgi:hypothetical protein